MRIKNLIGPMLFLAVMALSGCGGVGSGSSETTAPTTNPQTTSPQTTSPQAVTPSTVIKGLASKGPINTGTVKVFAIRNDVVDTTVPIGQGRTDATGNFTVDVGAFKGPVMVEVTGGTFTDEVSGATVALLSPMHAVFANASSGKQNVAVTPLTELATRRAQGHAAITRDIINESNKSVATTFNLTDIVSTLPVAGGTDDNQKKYAASCATFSQLANDRSKSSGESLDNALKGVMDDMGKEAQQTGLSNDSITKIESAVTELNVSGKNGTSVPTGGTSVPAGGTAAIPTPALTPTNGMLKISASGSPNIGALDLAVTIPPGVKVAADPVTGEAAAGAVAISGAAATGSNKMIAAKVIPASTGIPGKVTIGMVNGTGFGPGECITVDFKVETGRSLPALADFAVTGVSAKGIDGKALSGVTAAPASVGAL